LVDGEGMDEFEDWVQDTTAPEYVVIGDNRSQFAFEHLNRALRHLLNGSKLVAMQGELLGNSIGQTELNVGSWVGMLERAARIEATYLGKPSPYVFQLTLATMNLGKDQVVVIGDQVGTDIKGARDTGIRSILLRTGEFREQDLGLAAPDFVCDSIQEVLAFF
jgi:HAD superfamily hydrolase (TIGR01450 family)